MEAYLKNQVVDKSVLNMQDGDIAVITYWPFFDHNINRCDTIVQRYGDNLVSIGKSERFGLRQLFGRSEESLKKKYKKCIVRILCEEDIIYLRNTDLRSNREN